MIEYFTQQLAAVCPVHGLNSNGVIFFKEEATDTERQAAQALYAQLTSPENLALYAFNALTQQFEQAIQAVLDREAVKVGYDNILSACTYAYPGNPFQPEAESFVVWRSAVWAYCYQELAKVKNGTREMPTIEQIISELPAR